MNLKQTLLTLLVTSIFILGALFPPVWVILIILVYINKDRETKEHNESILNRPHIPLVGSTSRDYTRTSSSGLVFTDLNNYKEFKQAYLKTPQWNTLRKSILKRDNYTCQACTTNNVPLEVHHITYENFMEENDIDLISLCRECHERQHQYYGFDYNTKFYPVVLNKGLI